MLESGTLIDGKYRIVRRLASGGMGVVYLAHHERLDRQVALKLVLPEKATAELVERFRLEVRALGRIHSPFVAEAYDADVLETGELYLVMEYLDGCDLRSEIRRRGTLSVAEAATYVQQASRGAAAAHEAEVVHRDLKPQNLFLTDTLGARRVKLVDFGIARVMGSEDPALTQPECALGTPLYMAPEQIHSPSTVDGRADVWALGAILYELLAGFPAFGGPTPGAILLGVTLEDPVPLREINPKIPAALETIVLQALAKDPAHRLADALELAELLRPFAVSEQCVKQLAVSADVGEPRRIRPPRARRASVLSDRPALREYRERVDANARPSATMPIMGTRPIPDVPPDSANQTKLAVEGNQRLSLPVPGPSAVPDLLLASRPPREHLPRRGQALRWTAVSLGVIAVVFVIGSRLAATPEAESARASSDIVTPKPEPPLTRELPAPPEAAAALAAPTPAPSPELTLLPRRAGETKARAKLGATAVPSARAVTSRPAPVPQSSDGNPLHL